MILIFLKVDIGVFWKASLLQALLHLVMWVQEVRLFPFRACFEKINYNPACLNKEPAIKYSINSLFKILTSIGEVKVPSCSSIHINSLKGDD